MNTGEKASKLIEDRLKELSAEERKLRRALSHLGDRRPAQRQTRPGQRRAGRGERRRQLLEVLGKRPGGRAAELAKDLGLNPSQVHPLLRRAEAEGSVKRQGQGYVLA